MSEDFHSAAESQERSEWVRDPELDPAVIYEAVDLARRGEYEGLHRLVVKIEGNFDNLGLRLSTTKIVKALESYNSDTRDDRALSDLQKWLPRWSKELSAAAAMAEDAVWEWDTKRERVDWIIPGWIPRSTVTSIYASPGAGKSYISLQLACALARKGAQPWIEGMIGAPGLMVDRDLRVLYASRNEDPISTVAARVDLIGKPGQGMLGFKDLSSSGAIWGAVDRFSPSMLTDSGRSVLAMAVRADVGLLILDNISSIFEGSEIDRAEVARFLAAMNAWCRETGISIVLVGHLPKGGEAREAGYSGSTGWLGGIRHALLLDDVKPDGRSKEAIEAVRGKKTLSVSKTNLTAPPTPITIMYDKNVGRFVAVPTP